MKSYNGLFEQAINETELALEEAAKHKRNRSYVKKFYLHKDKNLEIIKKKLISGKWYPPKHEVYLLQEGAHKKERTIEKPYWNDEQIVHHILMRPFKPIVLSRLYTYSCGCIPYRGSHYLLRVFKHWRNSYKGKRFYVAELDIRKCYDTVDLSILKSKLKRRIRDEKYLKLLFRIIDVGEQTTGTGLPKGFYTSPWLLHFDYLELDNYILQELKPDHYARYMDNIWMFSKNKKKLHEMVRKLDEHIKVEYHQELKDDWQVYRFEQIKDGKVSGRPIDLLGFVIHANRVTLRKGIIKRIRAKAFRVRRKGRYTLRDCSALISYMGYLKYTDTHNYYLKWIKPKVSIRYCKARIRKAVKNNDRLENNTLSVSTK